MALSPFTLALARQNAGQNGNAPSIGDLRKQAALISGLDPSLAGAASGAVAPHQSLVARLLHVLDIPREAVFKYIVSPLAGRQVERGSQLFGPHNPLRGPLGFLADVGADPLTYLTAGVSGIGKGAAREAAAEVLGRTALETAAHGGDEAAKTVLENVARRGAEGGAKTFTEEEIANNPLLRNAYERATQQNYGKFLEGLSSEEKAALPKNLRGGIKAHVPFTKLEATVIPDTVTSRISGPLGAALKGNSAVGAASKLVKVGSGAKGVEGYLTVRSAQRAKLLERSLRVQLRDGLQEASNAFGQSAGGKKLLVDALEKPEVYNSLNDAQRAAVDKLRGFSDLVHEKLSPMVPDFQYRENYFPRVTTEEGGKVLYGERAGGGPLLPTAATPGFAKHRLLDGSLGEANAAGMAAHGVKLFEDNPYKALAQWGNKAAHDIAAHTHAQDLVQAHILEPGFKQTVGGLREADVKRAGFKDVKEARRAVLDGGTDARLAKLTPDARTALESEGEIAKGRSLGSAMAAQQKLDSHNRLLNRLTSAKGKKLGRADFWHGKVQEYSDKLVAHQQKVQHLQDVLEEAKANRAAVPGGVSKTATAAYDKAVATAQRQLKSALDEQKTLTKRIGPRSDAVRYAKQAERDAAKTDKQLVMADTRIGKQEARLSNAESGLAPKGDEWPVHFKGRATVPEGYSRIEGTGLGVLEGKYAPKPIAEELRKMWAPERISEAHQAYRNFITNFKRWVTVPFPGFWMKRAQGSWFLSYTAGVGLKDFERVGRLLKGADDVLISPELKMTVGDFKRMVSRNAVDRPDLQGFIQDVLPEQAKEYGKGVPVAKQISKAVNRTGTKVLGGIDNFFREATFLHGLEKFGGNEEAARLFTLSRHGDFSELTPFERKVAADLVPFYKWFRVKVPAVLHSVLENPARITRVTNFEQNVLGNPEKQKQLEEAGVLPAGASERGQFVAGGLLSKLLNPLGAGGAPTLVTNDLPLYSLNALTSPGNIAGELAPPIKALVELATHTSATPQGTIPAKTWQPVSGVYGVLARVFEKVPLLNHLVARAKGGELRLHNDVYSILQSLPSTRVAALADALNPLEAGGGRGFTGALGSLTGVYASPLTQSKQDAALYARKSQMDELIKELFRRGYGADFKAAGKQSKVAVPRGFLR